MRPVDGQEVTSLGPRATLDGPSHVPRPEGPRRPKAEVLCAEVPAVERDSLAQADSPTLTPQPGSNPSAAPLGV